MVGRSVAALRFSCPLPATFNADTSRKSAEIAAFPKSKLPPVSDYARACAALIWNTFPAPSQHGVCARAARETGIAAADTFDRIVSGKTAHIDGYLMRCVMVIAAARGIRIPAELAVRQ